MRKARGQYSTTDRKTYQPKTNIPDGVMVDDKTIYTLTDDPVYDYLPKLLLEPLAGKKERPWFTEHFYFCLPVTFGNQHGFIIKLLYDVIVRWNGGEDVNAVFVHKLCPKSIREHQAVKSHFGSGIVTIQNRWTFRTQPGMNLLVGPPPNFLLEGINPMTAVVQTDQLRRDFTLNLKITIPHRDIFIGKGTPVGWILPYPRNVIQDFQIKSHPEGPVLEGERETMRHFGTSRRDYEQGLPGHLYRKGVDIYGNKFKEHERMVTGQLPSAWREGVKWPISKVGDFVNIPVTSDAKKNLLPEELDLLNSILLAVKKISKTTMFNHIYQVYLYIQAERLEDRSDEEIQLNLKNGGWQPEVVEAIFKIL
jgi:hypothetical protein